MATFDDFWAVYPRKVDKAMARVKFEAITNGGAKLKMIDREGNSGAWEAKASPEELIIGAKAYALTQSDEDKRYIKHPTTWMNHGCWNDFENAEELARRYDDRAAKREAAQQKFRVVK